MYQNERYGYGCMSINNDGWENVKNEHMIQAAMEIKSNPSILKNPNKKHFYYFVYGGLMIPEKEVRRRAYIIANGKEPDEKHFYGGEKYGEEFKEQINGEYTIIYTKKINKGIRKLAQKHIIIKENTLYDEEAILDVNDDSFFDVKDDFVYSGTAKPKDKPQEINGHMRYPRNKEVMRNALAHAHYCCEYDTKHFTFTRKNGDIKYTEAHHLVPLAYSDDFNYSLDVEENVVSLCSNCHKRIHYGKDALILIQKLFEDRKEALKKVGISIELADLFVMYGFENI